MIELLGVIVILGLISFIAVAAVTKYVGTSRSKAFVLLSQSAYQATENCILHEKLPQCRVGETIDIQNDLYKNGYIEKPINPVKANIKDRDEKGNYIDGANLCSGTVKIEDTGYVDNAITSYKYTVDLNCPGYRHATIVWPNEKTIKQLMES